MKIIGPNCLGVTHPDINLNATFVSKKQKTGSIAFLSQSGALGSAILDFAAHENINFSYFVSVGSMIDVDFGDLINYFGTDPKTRSILMYIEGITDARKFMSAARHFARTKPIIVMKSGRSVESAKAAASHTGAITGEDMVYDAAFKRAGVVRVKGITDLFNCAEALGKQPLPKGPNLAIITNAGGPGVIASDSIIAAGGKLAPLGSATIEKLNIILPAHWSKGNPIDLLGDAKADRYEAAVEACLADEKVDGLLIIYTPQGGSDPADIAQKILDIYIKKKISKPLLTSFMGYEDVEKANRIFIENCVPTYSTPEQAVATYTYMYQYKRNLELLYETPIELPVDSVPPKQPIVSIIRNALKENRNVMTEVESKRFLEYYNIPIVKTRLAKNADEAALYASQIGYPVVLKILSSQIIHKTDAGGVKLDINSESQLKTSFEEIMQSVKKYSPDAMIIGITVQQMIKKTGVEVIIGMRTDPIFGPVIMFGRGGIDVELYKDTALGIPPLNQTLARRMMEETKVYQLLKGYRSMPPANLKLLEEIIVRFSQMIINFPQLQEFEINPLFINGSEAFAVDARGVINEERISSKPHEHLVISPYPEKHRSLWKLRDGRTVILRPIKPEDEPLWLDMFRQFSEESIRFRLFETIKDVPHEFSVRYCNIDYDRELSIVAEIEDEGKRKLLGVVMLITDSTGESGEISFIVADQWQGQGLGSKMVDYMIEICRDRRLQSIYAIMMPDNYKAIKLLRDMGFIVESMSDGSQKATLGLREEIEI